MSKQLVMDVSNSINLEALYSKEQMNEILQSGKSAKRIISEQMQLSPNHFAQVVDIDINLNGNTTRELDCMIDYPVRSVENAIQYIRELLDHGINAVVIRLGGNPKSKSTSDTYSYDPLLINSSEEETLSIDSLELLAAHEEVYRYLRSIFPSSVLHITADPFGVAPNADDGAWGIKNSNGEIDHLLTLELIAKISESYTNAEVDAILSLGRIEREVEVSSKTLKVKEAAVDIYSFSQNIESKAAYIYLDDVLRKKDSFQKILPGNLVEMRLRTILDIYEGANTIVVKPIENVHIVLSTFELLNDKQNIVQFLISSAVNGVIGNNARLKEVRNDILLNLDAFYDKCQKVKISTYTVSGSYFMHKILEKEKGETFTYYVLDELYKNVVASGGKYFGKIMDRNALWFVKKLKN